METGGNLLLLIILVVAETLLICQVPYQFCVGIIWKELCPNLPEWLLTMFLYLSVHASAINCKKYN